MSTSGYTLITVQLMLESNIQQNIMHRTLETVVNIGSPFEVSSGSGSGDEGCVRVSVSVSTGSETSAVNTVTAVSAAATAAVPDPNNSLPLKLRHKSHLGDKDAASALLSLQNIKQEPGPRASPPWDGEGSSDERDSGISLGAEWSNDRR
ncbi:vrille [Carabus blaptoides fortunei]